MLELWRKGWFARQAWNSSVVSLSAKLRGSQGSSTSSVLALREDLCWNGLAQQKTISSVSTVGANWVEAVIASESEARDSWAQYSLESVQLGIA
ncbi:BQ5605_C001g00898 [Microbotryum silenes-dioicae]|uniref:BQ5605_C001g00898 protein n=1 Tax=Microbotryum silenes-dioicae TaxID=796604 RepID=A0A2X0M8X6_9BASI|nr:BQ5605_C001g00898 [Microbotryum silenes-dioicae]